MAGSSSEITTMAARSKFQNRQKTQNLQKPLKLAFWFALAAVVSGVWIARPLVKLGLVASGTPSPSGAYPISTQDLELELPQPGGASTRIAVTLWAPIKPKTLAPSAPPLVIYVPVWGAKRTDNIVFMQTLTSHGFIVAALDDISRDAPGSDASAANADIRTTQLDLTTASSSARVDASFLPRLILQSQRVSQALNALLRVREHLPPDARFNVTRIGIVGASFGGATAATVARTDQRIRAAINLDGWMRTSADQHVIAIPFANINSTRGATRPEAATGAATAANPGRAVVARLSADTTAILEHQLATRADTIDITITGAGHADFNEELYHRDRWMQWRPWRERMIAPEHFRAIVDAYVLEFFNVHLNGANPTLLKQMPSPYPEVTIRLGRGRIPG
jgi:dienelactone hydrolase